MHVLETDPKICPQNCHIQKIHVRRIFSTSHIRFVLVMRVVNLCLVWLASHFTCTFSMKLNLHHMFNHVLSPKTTNLNLRGLLKDLSASS